MRFIELFAGIGGFRFGLEQVDPSFECVWANEIDKYASAIYRKNYGGYDEIHSEVFGPSIVQDLFQKQIMSGINQPGVGGSETFGAGGWDERSRFYEGDITSIPVEEIPRHDLLVAGFPCQAFSVAGNRGGFNDSRGTMFFEIARILDDKRPPCVLLENVKGLLSHDSGKTFQTILKILSDIGYRVEWQILNSKDFGVPQNRERVFIVGHLRGSGGRKVFPIEGENPLTCNEIGTVTAIAGNDILKRCYSIGGLSPVLNTCGGGNTEGKFLVKNNNGVINKTKECLCLDRDYYKGFDNHGQRTGVAVPVLTPNRPEKRQNGRRFKEDGDPAFTLTAQDRHGIYDNMRIRRLTPTECERLQGFPDGWTRGISDTQRYKCLGNAVTTRVISAIGVKLLK